MNNKIDALSEKPEIELDPTHVHQLLCNLPADSLKLFQEVEAFQKTMNGTYAQGRSKKEFQIGILNSSVKGHYEQSLE